MGIQVIMNMFIIITHIHDGALASRCSTTSFFSRSFSSCDGNDSPTIRNDEEEEEEVAS